MKEFRKDKRQRVARQNKEALALAEDPLADTMAAFVQIKDDSPEAEVVETTVSETKESETEKYCGEYYYPYYGGSLSFAELDAYLDTQAEVEHYESVTYQFKAIIGNILGNSEVGTKEKADMISAASEVFKMKLSAREKGIFGKIKEYVSDMFKEQKEVSDKEPNSIEIIVQKDGSKRWVGWFTNNYKDREKEIISEEAHKEFLAYLKEYPDRYPAFWSWHLPGTSREADTDYMDYFDGFMVASGPLTAVEADQLDKAIEYDNGEIGMSHGMYILERDPERKEIITKYRTYEISDLPLVNAANGFTGINSTKEVKMTDVKLDRLKAVIGEDAANKIVDQIGENKEALEAAGIESKESEVLEAIETVSEDPVDEKEPEEKPEDKGLDKSIKAIAVAVAEHLGMKELSDLLTEQKETIEKLTEQVGELQKEEDVKIAEVFEDKSLGGLLWKRASEAEETVVKDEDLEKVKSQEPSWVSDAFSGKD